MYSCRKGQWEVEVRRLVGSDWQWTVWEWVRDFNSINGSDIREKRASGRMDEEQAAKDRCAEYLRRYMPAGGGAGEGTSPENLPKALSKTVRREGDW